MRVTADTTELRKVLGSINGALRNSGAMWVSIGEALRTNIELTFRASADPWGNPWDQLSATTLARRRGDSAQILVDTGTLRNSFNVSVGKNHVEIGPSGPGAVYAATHQFGAKKGEYGATKRGAPIPWGTIPPRPFMPITPTGGADLPEGWAEEILEIVSNHLEAALRKR